MTLDLAQLLYYAGFAVLGWWLRHRGLLGPSPGPAPAPAPADKQALVELLKSLLDRLAQAPPPANPSAGVFHVPIEVAAGPRAKTE